MSGGTKLRSVLAGSVLLVTEEQFEAAHRGWVKGRRRGRDLLSGHVRCGLCQRVMTIDQRDDGRILYRCRCRHRGQVCRIPRRPTGTLLDAALLGMQLIGHDTALQGAIRDELGRDRETRRPVGTRSVQAIRSATDALLDRRRKLLKLHYDDKISAELFGEEERELTLLIDQARNESDATRAEDTAAQHMVGEFERVSQLLQAMDMRVMGTRDRDRTTTTTR